MRREIGFMEGHLWVGSWGGDVLLGLFNHETGDRLKIELIDLAFPGAVTDRIRRKIRPQIAQICADDSSEV
jgi:hypothetical protein